MMGISGVASVSALILVMLLSKIHSFSPAIESAAATVLGRKGSSTAPVGLWMAPEGRVRVMVSEIRKELDELGIDYSDCFDKESLVQRLKDSKEGRSEEKTTASSSQHYSAQVDQERDSTTEKVPLSTESSFDETRVFAEVRAMKVKELREELAQRRIRWADLIEKEDLIRAVVNARKAAHSFSSNIVAGVVADLTEQQVEEEIQGSNTPFLLDVYATWCGPCKMMAGELSQAAEQWKDRIRLAKMDSDKYPNLSSKLKVQGLPTIILFDNGQEVDRIEGALPREKLMQWVEGRISS